MDLGYMRWDYISLWFEMEPDMFHQHLQQLDSIAAAHPQCSDWKGMSKVKALGQIASGKRRYAVTAWGRGANIVPFLPVSYYPHIHRLDIKAWPEGYTMEDLKELRAEILNRPCGYNITMHDGKLRQKTDKRDAGGVSLGIGSHKSDLRVSIYGRGNENVCVEYQCSGDMLRRVLADVAAKKENCRDSYIFWVMVKDKLQHLGTARYCRALDTAGVSQWSPTTPEEREAAALDVLANTADKLKVEQHRQEELDIGAGASSTSEHAFDPSTGEIFE